MRLIVGISGKSGIAYGIRLVEVLRDTPVETHLVMTNAAKLSLAHECEASVGEVEALADAYYANSRIDAAIASGSFQTTGMIVAPGDYQGIIIAKTQVGYIEAKSGRELVFAIFLNNAPFGSVEDFIAADHDIAAVAAAIQQAY